MFWRPGKGKRGGWGEWTRADCTGEEESTKTCDWPQSDLDFISYISLVCTWKVSRAPERKSTLDFQLQTTSKFVIWAKTVIQPVWNSVSLLEMWRPLLSPWAWTFCDSMAFKARKASKCMWKSKKLENWRVSFFLLSFAFSFNTVFIRHLLCAQGCKDNNLKNADQNFLPYGVFNLVGDR